MYNWSILLALHYKKAVGIKKIHHFRMLSSAPGMVYIKEHTVTEEVAFTFLRENSQPNSASLPPRLEPQCLSDERKWYLYEHICPFCSEKQRMLHVHTQRYQIQDITALLDLRKQTQSSVVMTLTEPKATLLHRLTAIVIELLLLKALLGHVTCIPC